MIRRKISNKITYKEDSIGQEPLVETRYSKKVYFMGIKFLEHDFIEEEVNENKDVSSSKPMGFTKPNKKS